MEGTKLLRAWSSCLVGQTEGPRLIQPGEEMALETPSSSLCLQGDRQANGARFFIAESGRTIHNGHKLK